MKTYATIRQTITRGLAYKDWYAVANREIQEVCRREGWNADTFAAILALTSPRCRLRRNVQTTLRYFGQGELLGNPLPTVAIPLGHYLKTGEVNGPKTGPFYLNLTGLNPYAITIDTWVCRGLGIPDSIPTKDRIKGERAISKIGYDLGLLPCQSQAALWAGSFLGHGKQPSFAPILQEYLNWIESGRSWPRFGTVPRYVFNGAVQRRLWPNLQPRT